MHRIHLNGINNYSKILEIGFLSIKSFFISTEEINLDIDYEDYLELERDRKSIVENSKSGMREKESSI